MRIRRLFMRHQNDDISGAKAAEKQTDQTPLKKDEVGQPDFVSCAQKVLDTVWHEHQDKDFRILGPLAKSWLSQAQQSVTLERQDPGWALECARLWVQLARIDCARSRKNASYQQELDALLEVIEETAIESLSICGESQALEAKQRVAEAQDELTRAAESQKMQKLRSALQELEDARWNIKKLLSRNLSGEGINWDASERPRARQLMAPATPQKENNRSQWNQSKKTKKSHNNWHQQDKKTKKKKHEQKSK